MIIAPDVGTIVEYGMDSFGKAPARYRVSSWMRVAETPKFKEHEWLDEILFEGCRDFGEGRMVWCTREEATHVSLTGICGALARIEDCKVVGRVPWPEEQISQARASAMRLVGRMLF